MTPEEETNPAGGMSEQELCALIERESNNALGYDDLLAATRKSALEFYLGEAKGPLAPPEVDGRSSVVSKDLMDVVEWIMPSAMRLFTGTDEVATFQPDGPQDEQPCKDATRLVQHVIMEQNDGFTLLHDAIKNCLIQRMGVTKAYCEDAWDERKERYEYLTPTDVEALLADPSIEVDEQEQTEEGLFNISVTRREQVKKYRVEGVPPEEFGMNKDAKSVESARYVEHKVKRTLSDLKSMGYDPELVDRLSGDDGRLAGGEEDSRRSYEEGWNLGDTDGGDTSQREVTLTECYIKVDFDGDGISEYRRVDKAGAVVLRNEVTDDNPFSIFSPILMPYRPIGLGMYDLVEDLQRINTALTRQTLDSAYLANNPRTEVLETGVNFDDLLNPRPGGLVRVKAIGNIREIATPFVGAAGLTMLEHFSKVRDARTGVTEFNQGVAGDALGSSQIGSNAAQDMMASAMQRVELMLRVIGETGIKRLWRQVLKLVTQYQDRPMQMKINGRWLEIDPREWKTQYRTTISVGTAATSRQIQIANLNNILLLQEKAIQVGLATPQNIHNTLSRLTEQMGYRDPDQFWTNPETQPPPEPQPDPEQVKAQAAMQLEQMKGQTQMQIVQAESQADAQLEVIKQQAQQEQATAESQIELEKFTREMAQTRELEVLKAELAVQSDLAKAQIAKQQAVEVAQINAAASVRAAHPPEPVASGPKRKSGRISRNEDGSFNFESTEE